MDLDWNQIIDFVNTTAFPIVMCVILLWIFNGTLKTLRETLTSLEQTISNNTKVIDQMAEAAKAKTEKEHE